MKPLKRLCRRFAPLLLLAAAAPALGQPAEVTLEDVLRIVARSPRIVASERDADAARAERLTAGALPNPTFSIGRSRPAGGERTIFDASVQQQANVELPIPIFGQRAARERAADLQVGRADSQVRLTATETRRQAALEFVRLLAAQELLGVRRAAAAEVERVRGLVSGRLDNGMASRYDLVRADAEVELAALGVQRAEAQTAEHAALLAGLADARDWRPRAAGTLQQLRAGLEDGPGAEAALELSPALRVARDETAAAEARIEAAHRERFPVPSIELGRTWTSGPFGAANFIGLASEIPIFDDRRGLEDKARAEALAARERERGTRAAVLAERQRLRDQLELRQAALSRFESNVFKRQAEFQEMAEAAYRLGRGTLFELLDARRTQVEAAAARLELVGAIVEAQVELRALSGSL